MARKSKGPIEVAPEFLDGYKEIRNLLWKASDLIDDLALEVDAWPKRLRTRYERLQSAIDGVYSGWRKGGV